MFLPGTRERRRMKEPQCVIPTRRSGFDKHPPSILEIDEGRIVESAVREQSRFELPLRREPGRSVQSHRSGGRCLGYHEYIVAMAKDIRIGQVIRFGQDYSIVCPGFEVVAVRESDFAKSGPGTEGFEIQVPALARTEEKGISNQFRSRCRDVPPRENLSEGRVCLPAGPRIGSSEEPDRPLLARNQTMCVSGPRSIRKQSAGEVFGSSSGSGQVLGLSLIFQYGDNGMRANTGSAVS